MGGLLGVGGCTPGGYSGTSKEDSPVRLLIRAGTGGDDDLEIGKGLITGDVTTSSSSSSGSTSSSLPPIEIVEEFFEVSGVGG